MPGYTPPWRLDCDCRCPLHHHQNRITYTSPACRCAITCATQPITLLAHPWACALFLDQRGDLLHVPALPNGTWDWQNTAEVDSRSEFYDDSVTIERLLRGAIHALTSTHQ